MFPTLVEHFKFLSEKIDEKCFEFYRSFSPKIQKFEMFNQCNAEDLLIFTEPITQADFMIVWQDISSTMICPELSTLLKLDSLAISAGNPRTQSLALATLSWMKRRTGDYSAGREHAAKSQRLARMSGDLFMEAHALRIELVCLYALENYSQSILLDNRAREVLSLCGMSGSKLDSYALSNQAEVHMLKSEYVEARTIRTQVLQTVTIEQDPFNHASALTNIAQIDVEIGALGERVHKNNDMARKLLLDLGLKFKQKREIHKALQFLGDVFLADDDQQTAVSLLTVALDGFTKMDVHRSRAECMLQLGNISKMHRDLPKALELWKTTRPLFERSSQAKQVAHIDELLASTGNLVECHLSSTAQLSTLNAPTTDPKSPNVVKPEGPA
ncbi:hypothetical protein FB451DRAFT_1168295 [Mycena latifolia]|nr:hypothetical protein FB451DRAFT_1168295 [Mycena latifolia]